MARETKQDRKRRCSRIFAALKKMYPKAACPLDNRDPFRLLVSTVLSAQCTDKRVNVITAYLFKTYRKPKDFAAMPRRDLERAIRSAGLYRSKAKNIKAAARMIVDEFDGRVPDTMGELIRLPGVARKTANCVLSYGFGRNVGFVVDTHVMRLSNRLGLTRGKDPKKIEQDMMALTPQKAWGAYSLLLIYHGRAVCMARNPDCGACRISAHCPSAGKV